MIMTLMRTHETPMMIYDRKLHVLLSMECFSNSVVIYAFHQTPIMNVPMEQFLPENFSQKISRNIKIQNLLNLKNALKSSC